MKYILVILLAAAVATPATAATTKKKQRVYQQEQQLPQGLRQSRNSWDVYSADGRFIGRDPSPNVRQRLYDDERIRNGD